jgi:hypothetical protein
MATVFESILQKSSVLLCVFCVQKDSMKILFIKKCFLCQGGKWLSRKTDHTWANKRFADDEAVETYVWKWLWQQSKRFLCCGFRHTGKAMGQVYQCWWWTYREINVVFWFEYHMFYVLYPFVTYLLTLPRQINCRRRVYRLWPKSVMASRMKYEASVERSRETVNA